MPRSPRSSISLKPPNAESPSSRELPPLGLIAGNGDFPLALARRLRHYGHRVIAVGFGPETKKDLAREVSELHWISIGQLGKLIRVLKEGGVRTAFMAGQIRHQRLFADLKLDWQAVTLLAGVRDKRADSLLKAVADRLEKNGIRLESPLPWLTDDLPKPGVLTKRRPTAEEKKDVDFGYRIAKHVAQADIGQTVVVKRQAVLAVEGMEGTDACILRGGKLGRRGVVVVKVTKPDQDLRFDTPVLGPKTIQTMCQAGAQVLAFDSAKTLIIEKPKTLQSADAHKLTLIAI